MNKMGALLLLMIVLNSLLIVNSRYEYRKLTSEISIAKQETDRLKEEAENLTYDYNVYAKPSRILKWALGNGMIEPKIDNTILMEKP